MVVRTARRQHEIRDPMHFAAALERLADRWRAEVHDLGAEDRRHALTAADRCDAWAVELRDGTIERLRSALEMRAGA